MEDDSDSTGDSDGTGDSDHTDDSSPEDLDVVLSSQEGDAIRGSALEPGELGNAGEECSESLAGLTSAGPDGSLASQPAAASSLIADASDDPMHWTVDDVVRKLYHEPSLTLPPLDRAALAESLRQEGISGSIFAMPYHHADRSRRPEHP
jgi:hypothetical protein